MAEGERRKYSEGLLSANFRGYFQKLPSLLFSNTSKWSSKGALTPSEKTIGFSYGFLL